MSFFSERNIFIRNPDNKSLTLALYSLETGRILKRKGFEECAFILFNRSVVLCVFNPNISAIGFSSFLLFREIGKFSFKVT